MSGLALAPRQTRLPALLAAIALHAGVLALVILAPNHLPQPIGSSVPINIVSSAPFTDTRPAVQAPQTQAAAAPEPTPQAPPQPPAPVVAPPAFTRAAPTPPKPQAKPIPAPQPSLHAAATPTQAYDFNHLQQIIDTARRTSGQAASSAQRGPARAETAPQARPDAGQGLSQSDQAGLQQLLERLWVLQCGSPGVESVAPFKVTFTVTLSGGLLQPPTAGGLDASHDTVTAIVVRRALDAVRAAVPFAAPYYGRTISVTFNPKKAYASKCSD